MKTGLRKYAPVICLLIFAMLASEPAGLKACAASPDPHKEARPHRALRVNDFEPETLYIGKSDLFFEVFGEHAVFGCLSRKKLKSSFSSGGATALPVDIPSGLCGREAGSFGIYDYNSKRAISPIIDFLHDMDGMK